LISVWTFGQAMGDAKTAEKAEDTIFNLVPPTVWNPLNTRQRDAVVDRLLVLPTLEPWNESPIARTMLQAREDLRKVNGYKAILMITDGGDNRFERDKELKARYGSFAGFLKSEFEKSDIALHLVGFPPVIPEEVKAWQDFETVKDFAVPGKIYSLRDIP